MKPRIFVSSTFYDLKYVREDLSNFIKAHDFEPIMFEDGDIGYTPGRALDRACYETMRSADMVLLIIGGNYGSPAEGEVKDEFKEYISITRNEFKSAVGEGIPIYVFIDSKVYVEYEIYEMNYEEIVQIKDFLSKQWSDMFKKYLAILKENNNNENIKSAVEDMNLLARKMNLMLESMGKKILTENNSDEYDKVVMSQRIVQMCNEISAGFSIQYDEVRDGSKKELIGKLLDTLKDALSNKIFEKLHSRREAEMEEVAIFFEQRGIIINMIRHGFEEHAEEFNNLYNNQKESMIQELSKDVYIKQLLR